MRMISMIGLLAVASGLLSGCGARPQQLTIGGEVPAVPVFSAKHGLLLPEQTRQSLGLKLIEVEERTLATKLDLSLRVYRVERGVALATASVAPDLAKLLKLGQDLEIPQAQGAALSGKITALKPHFQKVTAFAEVLVEIPDPPASLTPGAFLQVSAKFESPEKVVTVPRSAVLETSEGPMVYAVSGEHLVRTAVKTGRTDGEFVEITDGLYTGDQVVLQPVKSLWMTELAAVKGGQSCCVEPPKGK